MLRDQFKRIAGREKVPLGTIEKDYMTSLLLVVLSGYPSFSKLVFKGGTCIKKVYFPEARFSMDLDFSCPSDEANSILHFLRKELSNQELHGIRFLEVREEEKGKKGMRISVKHEETSGYPTSVKLDLSFREDTFQKPLFKEVLNPYGYKLPSCRVKSLTLEEILAEKMRALMVRGAPRDVYDIWFLLKRGVRIRLDLVDEKLKFLERDRIFDKKLFLARVEEKRESWLNDLNPLLGNIPDFEELKKDIVVAIKNLPS